MKRYNTTDGNNYDIGSYIYRIHRGEGIWGDMTEDTRTRHNRVKPGKDIFATRLELEIRVNKKKKKENN